MNSSTDSYRAKISSSSRRALSSGFMSRLCPATDRTNTSPPLDMAGPLVHLPPTGKPSASVRNSFSAGSPSEQGHRFNRYGLRQRGQFRHPRRDLVVEAAGQRHGIGIVRGVDEHGG